LKKRTRKKSNKNEIGIGPNITYFFFISYLTFLFLFNLKFRFILKYNITLYFFKVSYLNFAHEKIEKKYN